MNSISWFLYAVDVMSSVDKIANIVLFLSFIGTVISVIFNIVMRVERTSQKEKNKRWQEQYKKDLYDAKELATTAEFFELSGRLFKMCAITLGVSLILSVFVPQTRTMYLMLGSEVGEEVVMSETGQRVQDAINKKLDEYLGDDQ